MPILQLECPDYRRVQLRIVDMAGRVINVEDLDLPAGSKRWQPRLFDLPAGLYQVVLSAEQEIWTKRFVISR